MTVLSPSALPTRASPIPVLPAVPSTTVPPGCSLPEFNASRMMNSAARSLTDWPGFMNSALPRMVQPVSSDARLSLISGVLPIASMIPLRGRTGAFASNSCLNRQPNERNGLPQDTEIQGKAVLRAFHSQQSVQGDGGDGASDLLLRPCLRLSRRIERAEAMSVPCPDFASTTLPA